ncbi:hypothetical protein SDC9_172276 [bioreactor metagenome]|uniref:Uncharacterized protein n=1 Tax=bioreactor metagenome TaxID=1076179 RepID=A0A645GD83_9ZZZZ
MYAARNFRQQVVQIIQPPETQNRLLGQYGVRRYADIRRYYPAAGLQRRQEGHSALRRQEGNRLCGLHTGIVDGSVFRIDAGGDIQGQNLFTPLQKPYEARGLLTRSSRRPGPEQSLYDTAGAVKQRRYLGIDQLRRIKNPQAAAIQPSQYRKIYGGVVSVGFVGVAFQHRYLRSADDEVARRGKAVAAVVSAPRQHHKTALWIT